MSLFWKATPYSKAAKVEAVYVVERDVVVVVVVVVDVVVTLLVVDDENIVSESLTSLIAKCLINERN